MSIKALNWVWKNSTTKGSERLVLLAIADNADDSGKAWPSLSTIAEKCNLSRRYIIRILDSLEQGGHIKKVVRRVDEMKNYSNIYWITFDKVVNPETLPNHNGSEPRDTTGSELEDTSVVNPSSPKPPLTIN